MTITEFIGALGATATALGVVVAVLVVARDRVELRELESVTSLINMKTPRQQELMSIQEDLLNRYLRTAKRRASGATRTIWAFVFGAIGAISFFLARDEPIATWITFGAFVIALLLIAPFYAQLGRDVVGIVVPRIRSRRTAAGDKTA